MVSRHYRQLSSPLSRFSAQRRERCVKRMMAILIEVER